VSETTVESRFRVYRVLPAVLQVNLFDVAADRLYTVFQSGYPDALQATVDDLSTGDLVGATLAGDPGAADEPWRLVEATRDPAESRPVGFATGVDYPAVAHEVWGEATAAADDGSVRGPVRPTGRALGPDGDAGEVWVQPRDALPGGGFTLAVLAGRVPLEPVLGDLEEAGAPAAELLVVDSDDPAATSHRDPFGVFLAFTDSGQPLADRYRERWGVERGDDSRPDVDPY